MMTTVVSKSAFKNRALAYFRQVESDGDPVVVTDHGIPTVEIRRYRPAASSPLERLRGTVLRYEQPMEPVGDEDWGVLR